MKLIRPFCKHKWEKLSEVVLPSAYEQMRENGETLDYWKGNGVVLFQKTSIVILSCTECGKIYKSRTSNPTG